MAFKILSIDGGGLKGMFPAAFLETVEKALGKSIIDYFDLIAGTSTGGIIAIALGLGVAPSELRQLYAEEGPRIFANNFLSGPIRHWITSKYGASRLKEALQNRFGERKLGDSKVRLLIPAFSAVTSEIHIYKTRHHPHLRLDWNCRAVDVAMATAAAPSYFPVHREGSTALIDGGIWANNPTGLAAVEAITMLNRSPSDLQILSLGCTQESLNVNLNWLTGKIRWAVKGRILDATYRGQSFGSLGTAYLIAGHERVCRIDPPVPNGRYSLDGSKNVRELGSLAYESARKALPQIERRFFQERATPFVPEGQGA